MIPNVIISPVVQSTQAGNRSVFQTSILQAIEAGDLTQVDRYLSQSAHFKDCNFIVPFFFHAVRRGSHEIVNYFLKLGVDVNAVYEMREEPIGEFTPLHFAALAGQFEVFRILIEHGGNPHHVCEGLSISQVVAKSGNCDLMEYLFIVDSELEGVIKDEKSTHLALAIGAGKLEMVRFLESRGANMKASDDLGETLMHHAARLGDLRIIRFLLEKGVSLNSPNKNRETPVNFATFYGHQAVVEFFEQQEVDLTNTDLDLAYDAASAGNLDLLKFLCDRGVSDQMSSRSGEPPIMAATSKGHLAVVRYLVERSKIEETPQPENALRIGPNSNHIFSHAVYSCDEELVQYLIDEFKQVEGGLEWVVKKLLCFFDPEYGSDPPRKVVQLAAFRGSLPLVRRFVEEFGVEFRSIPILVDAIRSGNYEVVKYLLDHGVDPNQSNAWNRNPMLEAMKRGRLDMVQLLLEKSGGSLPKNEVSFPNPHSLDVDKIQKISPRLMLYSIIDSGNIQLLEFFLNTRDSLDFIKDDDRVMCHIADKRPVLQLLHEKGLDMSLLRDKSRRNLLHLAAEKLSVEAIEYLLSIGLNPDEEDAHLHIPLFYALNGYQYRGMNFNQMQNQTRRLNRVVELLATPLTVQKCNHRGVLVIQPFVNKMPRDYIKMSPHACLVIRNLYRIMNGYGGVKIDLSKREDLAAGLLREEARLGKVVCHLPSENDSRDGILSLVQLVGTVIQDHTELLGRRQYS